ncbi:DNA packaging protein UL33 [Beluga whale alphaherpesvirus 1]|uniref:DNA packaging protein UL33 n=1 Tax=Beluga whale alphaherpesvirus 1 TaxID=1434720 RepID=A0A286MM47_9ALPH|nr:DNA packaging protein UL33 [Beluga whale alphaherpesvirus 1]ASW27073.1 DNA packaging protein UL33 [Beluga whale alphaherpesvirus 1]
MANASAAQAPRAPSGAPASGDPSGPAPALRDLIPAEELIARDVDALAREYLRDDTRVAIWFEDLVPPELEVLLPTTDAKLNYLAFTRNVASAVAYSDAGRAPCAHTEALEAKKARFAAVINKFLDLHQILHDV